MMVFDKTCGQFRVTVSDPSPMWVEIRKIDDDEARIGGFKAEDLADLRYLIERAQMAATIRDGA